MILQLNADREAAVAAVARQYDEAIATLERLPTVPAVTLADGGNLPVAPTPAAPTSARRRPIGAHPRGPDAVRRVLMETGKELTVRTIAYELALRGWAPKTTDLVNATSTNASRAAERLADVQRRKNPHGGYLYFYSGHGRNEQQDDEHASAMPERPSANLYAMPVSVVEPNDQRDPDHVGHDGLAVEEVMS